MKGIQLLSISSAILAISACGMNSAAGPLAPPFDGKTSTGQSVSMLDLTQSKKLLVVFLHPDGKVGAHALETAAKIQSLIGADKLNVLGVIAASADGFDQWTKSNAPTVPCIPDPDVRITQKYKAQVSPTFQVIDTGGIWGAKVEGCDATSMAELETALKLKAGELKSLADPRTRDSVNLWP